MMMKLFGGKKDSHDTAENRNCYRRAQTRFMPPLRVTPSGTYVCGFFFNEEHRYCDFASTKLSTFEAHWRAHPSHRPYDVTNPLGTRNDPNTTFTCDEVSTTRERRKRKKSMAETEKKFSVRKRDDPHHRRIRREPQQEKAQERDKENNADSQNPSVPDQYRYVEKYMLEHLTPRIYDVEIQMKSLEKKMREFRHALDRIAKPSPEKNTCNPRTDFNSQRPEEVVIHG